uniref:Uncharacterized protein n=1 Tax=Wuchereria bancrofti TaxID=6293 RepID=A0AAF5Q031_WUCBA
MYLLAVEYCIPKDLQGPLQTPPNTTAPCGASCGGQLGESFQPAINAPRLSLIGHVIATAQSYQCLSSDAGHIG